MSSIFPTARSHIACYVNGIGVVQPVNGYLGQDAHIADSVKAVRLMLVVEAAF